MSDLNSFEKVLDKLPLILYTVLYVAIVLVAAEVVLYFLRAAALYKMSRKSGLKTAWMAFVPILASYNLGKVAQKYVKRDGKKSAAFGIILLILNVIRVAVTVTVVCLGAVMVVTVGSNALQAIDDNIAMTHEMFSTVTPFVITAAVACVVSLVYVVFYYVSLWRIFAIFCYHNAAIFTALSVIFRFLAPVFLFLTRKYEPCFTFAERVGASAGEEFEIEFLNEPEPQNEFEIKPEIEDVITPENTEKNENE